MSGRGVALGVGGRQIDRNIDGRQRRRDHEDDQQHQDHVDERRDVDLVDLAEVFVAVVETHAHGGYSRRYGAAAIGRAMLESAAIEIAADDAQDFGGGIGMQRAIAGDPAREHVVHHHRRDRRHQAERGRQQRLGDAGRHHREIGGVRLSRCR